MQNNLISRFKSKFSNDIHLKEILKGSSIAFLFRIIGMGLGYIFTFIIARWYGADTMGLFALSVTILNIFVTVGIFGFDHSLVKFIADYNSNDKQYLVKEIYGKSLYITMPLTLILSISLYYNANFFAVTIFNSEALELFLQIIAFAITPFVLLRINAAVFRGLKNIKLYSLFQNVGIYLVSVVILLLVSTQDYNSSITIIAQCLAICVMMVFSFMYLKKHTYVFQIISTNMLKYKDVLKVSFPMLLTSSMALVMGWTDIIMLGVFTNQIEVGVYSVAVKLAAITSISLVAINTIAAPKFSELYSKGDMEGLKCIAQSSTKMMLLSSLPIILGLALFPDFILGIFGEDFKAGVNALWILLVGQFFHSICGSVGHILNMTGKQNIYYYITIIAVIINLTLNYLLAEEYGMIGVALATISALIFLNITSMLYINHKYKFLTIKLY